MTGQFFLHRPTTVAVQMPHEGFNPLYDGAILPALGTPETGPYHHGVSTPFMTGQFFLHHRREDAIIQSVMFQPPL